MTRDTVISIDAMGGDHGPGAIVSGMLRALDPDPELHFILHGDSEVIGPLIERHSKLADCCSLRHAPDVVDMADQPSRALRERRDSSMWQAVQTVRRGEAGVAISAGNTGALLAMSVMALHKAPGVDRPAIAVHWPAARAEGYTTVLDVGADLRADPEHLAQYAVMGAEYARLCFGLARPRVGLLNLGTEPSKGPEALREAARRIAATAAAPQAEFDYIGFVEGTDIPTDRADVVVTDGFTGNIALKTAEGTASFLRQALKNAFRNSWASRIAALFAATSLGRLRRRIDPRRVNGGVFLGLNGAVVKSHGAADAVGFASAVGLAAKMARTEFPAHVASQLAMLRQGRESDSGTGRKRSV